MGTLNPEWHGASGFIRVEVNDCTRVNVYHPDLPPRVPNDRGAIHNHRYDMTSRCLYGGLEHIVYRAIPRLGGHYTVYNVIHDEFFPCEQVDLEVEDRIIVNAGETLRFGGLEWFHRVVPHGQTVTCVTRIADVSEGKPCQVLCRSDLTPMNAFAKGEFAPSETLMRMHVAAAFAGVVFEDVFK